MSLFAIVLRILRQHLLSTVITSMSLALASGLLISVWVLKVQSESLFTGMSGGYDAVLGARGSKLQLVLNAVFHLEESPGNLKWTDYELIQNNRAVAYAFPISVGDNYKGYRLVGTLPDFFKPEFSGEKEYRVKPGGRVFSSGYHEALVGSFVAEKLRLKPGDTFHPYHGLIYDENHQHSETYLVTGVLEATNSPDDRVIWIPIEGVQKMSGHDPEAADEISAVLVKLNSASAGFRLDSLFNKKGDRLTFAWPIGRVMANLFNKINWFDRILELVAYLVVLVAAGSVMASIYNTMNERRRDIAIMRALGARKRTIFGVVVLEAGLISSIGAVFGFLVYGVILTCAASVLRRETGVVLDPLQWHPVMLWVPLGIVGLGALMGVVPAIKGYRTQVAKYLAPLS